MTGAESIPFTAWEQAALIGLFIVFAGVVVTALIKWFNKQSASWQQFMTEERKTSQEHVTSIDDKWRQFNKEQRDQNNCAMADVNNGLSNLAKVTEGLVLEVREMRQESREISAALAAHDDQAKEIKHLVEVNNKPTPKPRTKKAAGPLE